MSLSIPIWVMIVLIICAWLGVAYLLWFRPKIMPILNEHFAQRRHLRRVKTEQIEGTAYRASTRRDH